MAESQSSPKSIIKTSVVKFLEHLQGQKDSLEKELSYLLEELRLNSVHIQSAKAGGTYSISDVNQIVRDINTTLTDYFKKTYTSISVDASRRMRLVLEDLLKLVGGALGEADINEIIAKIEAFESQMSMAEEMAGKAETLEKKIQERDAEIEKLKELVERGHLEKEELEKESTERSKKIDDLENEIARLESELKSLLEQIESGDTVSVAKIEELEKTIEDRDKKIETLVGERDKRIEELETATGDCNERVEKLESVIAERENEIAELKTKIEGLDLSEKEDTIETLRIRLQEKEQELEYLQMQLQEKGVEIKTRPRSRPVTSFQFEWFPCISMTRRKSGT